MHKHLSHCRNCQTYNNNNNNKKDAQRRRAGERDRRQRCACAGHHDHFSRSVRFGWIENNCDSYYIAINNNCAVLLCEWLLYCIRATLARFVCSPEDEATPTPTPLHSTVTVAAAVDSAKMINVCARLNSCLQRHSALSISHAPLSLGYTRH